MSSPLPFRWGLPRGDFDIRWRVDPCGHSARRWIGRIQREDVVQLDFHVGDTQGRSRRDDQPGNGGPIDHRGLCVALEYLGGL
jgi:hypothetical protein